MFEGFIVEPDGGLKTPTIFGYNGHQVEIVPPEVNLLGRFWQIKIDGVLWGNYLFNSARTAGDEARKVIDRLK